LIEPAPGTVAARDHHDRAAAHCVASAVETKAVHLLGWPVTLYTILLQQRLNISSKINFACYGRRRGRA